MSPCDSLETWIQNSAAISVPGFFSATLLPYNQSMYTTTCGVGSAMDGGYACDSPNVTLLGTSITPEMSVTPGANSLNFSLRVDLTDAGTILGGFIFPMFMPTHGNKARLILTSDDVTLRVLGIKIGGLKMYNELTCTGQQVLDPIDIPNSICYPDQPDHDVANGNGYYMTCDAGAFSLTASTTTTIANTNFIVV